MIGAASLAVVVALGLSRPADVLPSPPNIVSRAPVWHRPDLPHAKPSGIPQRIVSLAPVVTETLFLFGAGPHVVGDTRFCDRPPEAVQLPKVGGYVDISLEAVLGLKPDLVVAMPSLGQRDVLDRLRERGIPVLVVFADNSGEVHSMLQRLGIVTGTLKQEEKVDRALFDAESHLSDYMFHIPQQSVAVVVGTDPLVIAGPNTFAAESVAMMGLNAPFPASAPDWPVWSPEALASSKVDILFVAEPSLLPKVNALVALAFPAGKKKPQVVASTRSVLMRPGPALIDDLPEMGRLIAAAARSVIVPGAPPPPMSGPTPTPHETK